MSARLPTTRLRPANAGPIHVGQTMMTAIWGLPNFASLFAFPMINGHQAVRGGLGGRGGRTGRGRGGRGSSQAPRPRKARVCELQGFQQGELQTQLNVLVIDVGQNVRGMEHCMWEYRACLIQ